jgi:uncharacterized membrane protein YhaH (DUF805 family)
VLPTRGTARTFIRVLAGMPRYVRYWFTLLDAVDRRTYLATGLGLMAFKYAVDAGAVFLATGRFWSPLDYLLPLYLLRAEKLAGAPAWFLPVFVLWTLPFLWIGVAMTLRRAVDAGRSPWLALAFFVPLLNYVVMLALCRLPTVPLSPREERAGGRTVDARPALALYGLAAGLAVAIPTILLNVYVLRRYSTSLFLGTPFTLGAVTAYVFNREARQGVGATMQIVTVGLVLLAGAVLLFALEGLVCVALALPLALALALAGGIFGRAIALHTPGRAGHLASLVLAVPLLAGLDEARRPTPRYEVDDSVVVAAPPAAVWRNVVRFSELPPPTEALFRLGIAYPIRARIDGAGAGATRHCEFSTGTFVEPITVWEAPTRLSFDITAQPVPLRELSPYGTIAPPHLHGYFRARRGAFRLTALPGGRTLLVGSTWYELDIEPRGYWRVPADAIVSAIHRRVLLHIKRLTEAGS